MSNLFERAAWPACTSALQLDRLALGELVAEEADALRNHLEECERCAAADESLALQRKVSLPPLRLPAEKPATLKLVPAAEEPASYDSPRSGAGRERSRGSSWAARAAGVGVLLAAAAALFVVTRPAGEEPSTERSRGAQVELVMFVQHADQVRRALPGETVAVGDAVRFALTSPSGGFAAVLSLDPRGRAFVYYPMSSKAQELPAGREVALPLGTRLDDSVGDERLLGLVCDHAVELEPLREALERGQGAVIPAGCEGSQWSFVKR